MKTISERYQPNVEAGEEFRKAMAQIAPSVQVTVMKPGDTRIIST